MQEKLNETFSFHVKKRERDKLVPLIYYFAVTVIVAVSSFKESTVKV